MFNILKPSSGFPQSKQLARHHSKYIPSDKAHSKSFYFKILREKPKRSYYDEGLFKWKTIQLRATKTTALHNNAKKRFKLIEVGQVCGVNKA